MNRRILVVCALLLAVGGYVHFVKPVAVVPDRSLLEFPAVVGDWRMVREDRFSPEILAILRASEYLSREYRDSRGRVVTLYVGFHGTGGVHSPKNCLPSSGWGELSRREVALSMPDGVTVRAVESEMRKDQRSVLFLYWYQIRNRTMTSEYALKLAELWNSLTARRRDESFIRLSASSEAGREETARSLTDFARVFFPVIREYLPS